MAAVVLAAAAVLAGCTSVRNDLGTSNSGCYVALPAASAAVGDVGRLLGVRLVDVSSLPADSHLLYRAATTAPGPTVQRVCLVGFAGHFEAAGVGRPVGRPSGTLAVVELAYPDSRLLATLLVGRDTLPFGHSHLGLL
ncbi:MAG TPA: hypothetical protein VHB02_02690 [Acidimicrobiales bacterium]|nr:hypothetical protein [Acidimicrobiales bacterium]